MKEKKITLKIFVLIGIFLVLIGTREIFHRIIWKKTEAEIQEISNANASHLTEKASYLALLSFEVDGQTAVGLIMLGMVFLVVGLQKFPCQRKSEPVKEPQKEKTEEKPFLFTEELNHKMELFSEEENEPVSGLVNEIINLSEDELNIMRLMAKEKTITQDELANRLQLSKSSVKRKILKLKEKGMITRVGADKKGYWKILK